MVAATVELVFITGRAIRKRHRAGQSALRQQLERAVDRGKADLRILLSHQAKKFVGRKMVAGIQESAQDGIALLRMFQSYAFQVLEENVLGLTHGFTCGWRMIVDSSL